MPEAAPGTECRQHMVSLSTRWYVVSPPVPSSEPNARKTPVGAAAQRAGHLLVTRVGGTAWGEVKRGAEATEMHQKHPVKALRALTCPCSVTERWGRRLARHLSQHLVGTGKANPCPSDSLNSPGDTGTAGSCPRELRCHPRMGDTLLGRSPRWAQQLLGHSMPRAQLAAAPQGHRLGTARGTEPGSTGMGEHKGCGGCGTGTCVTQEGHGNRSSKGKGVCGSRRPSKEQLCSGGWVSSCPLQGGDTVTGSPAIATRCDRAQSSGSEGN